jgi:hypothetical protein
VSCSFIGSHVLSGNYLGLAAVVPGTENLLVRASELVAVSAPGRGDYIVEDESGLRRNIEGARLDPTGVFYVFQTVRGADEDWGDLIVASVSEDWGGLTSATEFEDRLALN